MCEHSASSSRSVNQLGLECCRPMACCTWPWEVSAKPKTDNTGPPNLPLTPTTPQCSALFATADGSIFAATGLECSLLLGFPFNFQPRSTTISGACFGKQVMQMFSTMELTCGTPQNCSLKKSRNTHNLDVFKSPSPCSKVWICTKVQRGRPTSSRLTHLDIELACPGYLGFWLFGSGSKIGAQTLVNRNMD